MEQLILKSKRKLAEKGAKCRIAVFLEIGFMLKLIRRGGQLVLGQLGFNGSQKE